MRKPNGRESKLVNSLQKLITLKVFSIGIRKTVKKLPRLLAQRVCNKKSKPQLHPKNLSWAPFHSNKDSLTRSWLIWANCLTMRGNHFWRNIFYSFSFYKIYLDTKTKNFSFVHEHYFICQFARNSWVIIYLSMQCDRNYRLLLIYQVGG